MLGEAELGGHPARGWLKTAYSQKKGGGVKIDNSIEEWTLNKQWNIIALETRNEFLKDALFFHLRKEDNWREYFKEQRACHGKSLEEVDNKINGKDPKIRRNRNNPEKTPTCRGKSLEEVINKINGKDHKIYRNRNNPERTPTPSLVMLVACFGRFFEYGNESGSSQKKSMEGFFHFLTGGMAAPMGWQQVGETTFVYKIYKGFLGRGNGVPMAWNVKIYQKGITRIALKLCKTIVAMLIVGKCTHYATEVLLYWVEDSLRETVNHFGFTLPVKKSWERLCPCLSTYMEPEGGIIPINLHKVVDLVVQILSENRGMLRLSNSFSNQARKNFHGEKGFKRSFYAKLRPKFELWGKECTLLQLLQDLVGEQSQGVTEQLENDMRRWKEKGISISRKEPWSWWGGEVGNYSGEGIAGAKLERLATPRKQKLEDITRETEGQRLELQSVIDQVEEQSKGLAGVERQWGERKEVAETTLGRLMDEIAVATKGVGALKESHARQHNEMEEARMADKRLATVHRENAQQAWMVEVGAKGKLRALEEQIASTELAKQALEKRLTAQQEEGCEARRVLVETQRREQEEVTAGFLKRRRALDDLGMSTRNLTLYKEKITKKVVGQKLELQGLVSKVKEKSLELAREEIQRGKRITEQTLAEKALRGRERTMAKRELEARAMEERLATQQQQQQQGQGCGAGILENLEGRAQMLEKKCGELQQEELERERRAGERSRELKKRHHHLLLLLDRGEKKATVMKTQLHYLEDQHQRVYGNIQKLEDQSYANGKVGGATAILPDEWPLKQLSKLPKVADTTGDRGTFGRRYVVAEENKRTTGTGFVGVPNLGTTCHIASAFHFMHASKIIRQIIEQLSRKRDGGKWHESFPAVRDFFFALSNAKESGKEKLMACVKSLSEALTKSHPKVFRGGETNDPPEVIAIIREVLECQVLGGGDSAVLEAKWMEKPSWKSPADAWAEDRGLKEWYGSRSALMQKWGLVTCVSYECTNGHVFWNFDTAWNLMAPMGLANCGAREENGTLSKSLDEALRDTLGEEQNDKQCREEGCQCRQNRKIEKVVKLHDELVIQIERKDYALGKIRGALVFNPEDVDLSEFIWGDKNPARYKLVAAVAHEGGGEIDGHCVAYRRNEDVWYCLNDSVVVPLEKEVIMNSDLVLCLFTKVTGQLSVQNIRGHTREQDHSCEEQRTVETNQGETGIPSENKQKKPAVEEGGESKVEDTSPSKKGRASSKSKEIRANPSRKYRDDSLVSLGRKKRKTGRKKPKRKREEGKNLTLTFR
jgi:hypothetical protein